MRILSGDKRKRSSPLIFEARGDASEAEQENAGVEAAHRMETVAETAARRSWVTGSRINRNHYYQKQHIRREYATARKAASRSSRSAARRTEKTVREKTGDTVKTFFIKHGKLLFWLGAGILFLVLVVAGLSSCAVMLSSAGSEIVSSSYWSEDEDMLGAETQYCAMEAELQEYLDCYANTHHYDEYHYDLDELEHDPYVLISILSALHDGVFTIGEVQEDLSVLFEKQYLLTETVSTETRHNADGDPYSWTVCTVTLENFDLSHVPVYLMEEDRLALYATYLSTLGNREDLFPNSEYVDKYKNNPPEESLVNPAYLSDERFHTLITEAEKYLGYPYVWGGSNPNTSFDCSGFVSYVLTNSGLCNTGRLGAQGLYNICTPVSVSDARPGDLIFFVGTYDTPGVSHVGFYVGDGMMLHCGDPIQYTSIRTAYWQSHFYAFGRPDY